jgi:hypothetical protein
MAGMAQEEPTAVVAPKDRYCPGQSVERDRSTLRQRSTGPAGADREGHVAQ